MSMPNTHLRLATINSDFIFFGILAVHRDDASTILFMLPLLPLLPSENILNLLLPHQHPVV